MRILVLGGTRFLGRAFVEAALARGHVLTLFHRGRSGAELFPGVERIHGDREHDLARLTGRTWDVLVDPSGYLPRLVAASCATLAPRVGRALFVSSISVLAEPLSAGADESAPVATLADPAVETIDGTTYGGLKARCEAEVRAAFGARATIVRPGLIVGPHDTTDRFPYWPRRLARGGEVLAPGVPSAPCQLIDVRDLAAWMLDLVERDVAGTFHATGPAAPLVMGEALTRIAAAVGGEARLTWVDEAFLVEHDVHPWVMLPLWLHAADAAFAQVDASRAQAAGLRLRPLEQTARDTWAWEQGLAAGAREGSPTLSAAREAELLAAWHARS